MAAFHIGRQFRPFERHELTGKHDRGPNVWAATQQDFRAVYR